MKTREWVLALGLIPSLLVGRVGAAESGVGAPLAEGRIETAPRERLEKPVRPARTEVPEDVKRMLDQFRAEQKAKLEEYRKLANQARDAGAEKRDQLRNQLRQLIEDQKAEREKLREQIRDRLQELAVSMPNRKELLDAAKEQARDKKERAKGE